MQWTAVEASKGAVASFDNSCRERAMDVLVIMVSMLDWKIGVMRLLPLR